MKSILSSLAFFLSTFSRGAAVAACSVACAAGSASDVDTSEGAATDEGAATTKTDGALARALELAEKRKGGTVCGNYTGLIVESLRAGVASAEDKEAFRAKVRANATLKFVLGSNVAFYEVLGEATLERADGVLAKSNIGEVAEKHDLEFRGPTNGIDDIRLMRNGKAKVRNTTDRTHMNELDAKWSTDETGTRITVTINPLSGVGFSTRKNAQTFTLVDLSTPTVGTSYGLEGAPTLQSSDAPCK
jgi:hypothetical protein